MNKILLLTVSLFFIIKPGFTQTDTHQEKLWTLTRVYGVVKYYNNEKDDRYLDDVVIDILPKLKDTDYSADQLNDDLLFMLPANQRDLNEKLISQNPFDQFEGTDHKRTIDFSWIEDKQMLSEANKRLLWQLLNSYKGVKNSNIKKKSIYVHHESEVSDSLKGHNLYLLGLIKFWNVIEYFFPYKPLMDEDWNTIFYNAIPGFQYIKSDEDYFTMLKKLTAKLDDSHAYVEDEQVNDIHVSKLPFIITVAENKMVIKSINDSLSNLYHVKTGDVIEEIDGKNYKELWQEFSELTSYSTPQSGRDDFKAYLFLRSNYNDSTLTMRIKSGSSIHNESISTISLADYIRFKSSSNHEEKYRSINNKIGYIDYDDLNYGDLGKAIRKLKHQEYLILDFRGFNSSMSNWRLLTQLEN